MCFSTIWESVHLSDNSVQKQKQYKQDLYRTMKDNSGKYDDLKVIC